ncbi:hypothetical protein PoB_005727500 [Plakobranchus ocellatus]|uniref:Uncharacterized protein n=1 Tax=Plakobranchus ocellatus TaxID=259542 RepID=A0AAV4CGB2_9GAST|nr:hypothetical protein PoB_005727500 [Plakobranchus ocellatus]
MGKKSPPGSSCSSFLAPPSSPSSSGCLPPTSPPLELLPSTRGQFDPCGYLRIVMISTVKFVFPGRYQNVCNVSHKDCQVVKETSPFGRLSSILPACFTILRWINEGNHNSKLPMREGTGPPVSLQHRTSLVTEKVRTKGMLEFLSKWALK